MLSCVSRRLLAKADRPVVVVPRHGVNGSWGDGGLRLARRSSAKPQQTALNLAVSAFNRRWTRSSSVRMGPGVKSRDVV